MFDEKRCNGDGAAIRIYLEDRSKYCISLSMLTPKMFHHMYRLVSCLIIFEMLCPFGTAFVTKVNISPRLPFSYLPMSDVSLDPAETAIVFIEYQNEFTTPGGKLHDAVKDCMEKTNMLSNSARLAVSARAAGCTIIHCPINFEPVSGE